MLVRRWRAASPVARRHAACCVAVLLLPLVAPTAVHAQRLLTQLEEMNRGTRVRLETDAGVMRGSIGWIAADTLFLESRGKIAAAVPLGAVQSYRVAVGDPRGRGLLRGAMLGAGAGALIFGISQAAWPSDCDYCFKGSGAVVLEAVGGALLFTPIGAVLGAAIGWDRWGPEGVRTSDRDGRPAP
jgi:hypothetical protein